MKQMWNVMLHKNYKYVNKSFQNLVANRPPVAKPSISDTDQVSGIFEQVLELSAHKL